MNENKHTISDLYQMQALPLSAKIRMTERRIEGWIDEFGTDGVYVPFTVMWLRIGILYLMSKGK